MGKKKVLLVQPHSDDIMFSATYYLFNRAKYKKMTLLTVESDEKRLAEDLSMAEHFNLKQIKFPIEYQDKTYYTYYKTLDRKTYNLEDSLEACVEELGLNKLLKIKARLVKTVKKYKEKGYEIVVPLGVGHPMHQFIADSLKDLADVFYRDFPHSYKRKTKQPMLDRLEDYKLSFTHFDKDQHDEKFKLLYQFYKTQRSLLWFEKGYIEKDLAEEFYERK